MISRHAIFAVALGLFLLNTAFAQQALVRSFDNSNLEVGQAYLAHYGARCIAVLPTHVVDESGDVAAFLREGREGLLGESSAFADLGDDVSVADITGGITKDCGYSTMAISRAVGSRIRANAIGSIRSVNGDGSIAQLSVTIVDDDGHTFLRVQPTNDVNQLRKGLSGSLLMSGDTPIGMLLSVNARFGVGKVIRFDRMFDKIDSFVAGRPGGSPAGTETSQTQAVAASEPLTDANGAITSWSAMPVDARHRASNLVATDDSPEWIAQVDQWPVVIEMDVAGGRIAIGGIELDATGVADTGTLPAMVELMVSATESGRRWRSVAGGPVTYSGGVARISIAPSWARQVRLVINAAADGGSKVALRRLRVVPAN
ncbi:MAG: hypothetical protein ACR2QX_08475 [Woeseiaceae bacterium]